MSEHGGPEGPGAAGRSGLPEHEQRAWDAIVADLRGQLDLGPAFPAERSDQPGPTTAGDHPDPLADPVELDDDESEGHRYVPPEPPPLPRPADTAARLSWAAVVAGPVLAIGANLLRWDDWLVGAGIAITVGGFVALMARRTDREDDGNDGAVV